MEIQNQIDKLFYNIYQNSDFFSKPSSNFKIVKDLFAKYLKMQIYKLNNNKKCFNLNDEVKNNSNSNIRMLNSDQIENESLQESKNLEINQMNLRTDHIDIPKISQNKNEFNENNNNSDISQENNRAQIENISSLKLKKYVNININENSTSKRDICDFHDKKSIKTDLNNLSDLLNENEKGSNIELESTEKQTNNSTLSDHESKFSHIQAWLSIKNNNLFDKKKFRDEQYKLVDYFFEQQSVQPIENIISQDNDNYQIKVCNQQDFLNIKMLYHIPQLFACFLFRSNIIDQIELNNFIEKFELNISQIRAIFKNDKKEKLNKHCFNVFDYSSLKFQIDFNIKLCYISIIKSFAHYRYKDNFLNSYLYDRQQCSKYFKFDQAHGNQSFVLNNFYILDKQKLTKSSPNSKQEILIDYKDKDFSEGKCIIKKQIDFLKIIE